MLCFEGSCEALPIQLHQAPHTPLLTSGWVPGQPIRVQAEEGDDQVPEDGRGHGQGVLVG